MRSTERDKLASGANPRERVAVPRRGERCPRCHRGAGSGHPCLLCAPELVPIEFAPGVTGAAAASLGALTRGGAS